MQQKQASRASSTGPAATPATASGGGADINVILDAAVRPDLAASSVPGQIAARGLAGTGEVLPFLDQIQASFGAHDVGGVRAHVGGEAANASRQLGATAFATGRDVAFASSPDLHTAAHEAAHVVQQRAGVHLEGGVGEDEDAYERHADAVADAVVAGRSAESLLDAMPAGGGTCDGGGAASVQRKGATPLMTHVHGPLRGWAMTKIGEPLEGYDPQFKLLFEKINAYDRSEDGRPSAQLELLTAMLADLTSWYESHAAAFTQKDHEGLGQLLQVLIHERDTVQEQCDRLNRVTANDDSPYEQMTDEGMLWSHPENEYGTRALGKTGKAYFAEVSGMNRQSMGAEADHDKLPEQEWFRGFVERARIALSAAVVNHYTTSTRAQLLVADGMKSKMMLEKTNPSFKHNTSAYDDLGLANGGFLFFFIESPNAPIRKTRFAEGDDGAQPARISIPIQESGLLTRGWIMLSDFAQREYPDIATNKENNTHKSWLSTRAGDETNKVENKSFTEPVKHFRPGLAALKPEEFEAMEKEKDADRRSASAAVTTQVRGDKDSKQVYTGPEKQRIEIPDRMFQNILVGADIIPGLATRAALEVARIARVNLALAKTFMALEGEALMLFMLKDLFRPQAMIPNSLKIVPEYVKLGD